jgi:hypothetical protein
MTFDELKQNWQQQKTGKLSIDSGLLLKEVQRNKRHFESAIFWRDVRETGACFAGSVFLFAGCVYFWSHGPKNFVWPLLLFTVLNTGVGTFILVDRIVQKRKCPKHDGTLMGYIESSLTQVVHQIWLLKNILWWCLLPIGGGSLIWFSSCGLIVITTEGVETFFGDLFYTLACIIGTIVLGGTMLLGWGIYWLNQRAIRKYLIPRQQELMQLQNSLQKPTE